MDEIVKAQPKQIISTFDDAERAARAMAGSGFFQDARQANQAVVKILAGQELGFGPFASMTGVAIIQGKPAVGANLQAAAVKRTGKYNYRVIEMTNEACELEFYEEGKPVGKSRFTMQDAQAAGLSGKDNWRKFPRNMLFARAISNGVKWYAPDIFNGATVYTPDELGANEDGDGNIIDAPATDVSPAPAPMTYEQAAAVTTPKGTPLGNLTIDQLNQVISKTGDNNLRHAAEVVLAHDFNSEPPADTLPGMEPPKTGGLPD